MTWNELATRIAEMSKEDRAKTVHYLEPWQDGAEIFSVDLYEAKEDLSDPEDVVKIKKGEFFLQ